MSTVEYSFDPNLTTDKDYIRSRIGDVNDKPQWFLTDKTINAMIARFTSLDEATAQCAEMIGAQCIQLASRVSQRNLSISYGERAKQAYELADRIRNLAASQAQGPPNTGAAVTAMQEPDMRN